MLLAASCAGTPSRSAASPADRAVDEWSDLSYDKKHARMTFTVHPVLARRFKKASGKPNATLTCRSCHGRRAEEVRYRMPAIEPLRPSKVAKIYDQGADVSRVVKFMRDVVTPTTARLMRMPVYDPRTGVGIGCFSCHLKQAEN